MIIKTIQKMMKTILLVLIFSLVIMGILRIAVVSSTASQIHATPADVPSHRAAIVFGAGLNRDGSPTAVLKDRIETAAELYFQGKVEKILFSGDNRFVDYNEPGAMQSYALELGVPPSAIVLDYAGRRTYDTCYRAKAIFGLTDAILVTQAFHLPRALVLCEGLGIQADGVKADRRTYTRFSYFYWNTRELPATAVALIEGYVTHPLPVLGEPEPIFPSQTQE